ncbi:hypothetical protein ANO14919_118040 [Xylariales sp. No.14919]|nr:hypothetical protein ANO14919_118040 [Xylariales sp. No.14919]
MATWGGSSRDGRIAPNGYSARNNIDLDTDADPNTNTYASVSTSANTLTNTNNGGSGDTTNFDYFCAPFDDPNIHNLVVSGTISSRYSFPPLPSPPVNDSFFATLGNTLHGPFYTTPNTVNFPLLHIGRVFHGAHFTPPRETLLPTPPTTTPTAAPTTLATELGTVPALPQALAHQDHHSTSRFPGHHTPRFGGYNFHGHSRNYQPRALPDIQDSTRSSRSSVGPSLSSFATAPATQSQSHMNTVNCRLTPPTSQAQCFPGAAGAAQGIDDYYLTALATQEFSSPSLPPLSSSPSPTTLSPSGESKLVAEMPAPSARRRISNRGAVDLTKEEPNPEAPDSSVDSSIPLTTMPVTTRRRSLTSVADSAVRKRRPSVVASPYSRPNKVRRKVPSIDYDDQSSPFDDDDLSGLNGYDGSETIDLSNATEVPAELMAPKVDNRVKIGKFQCVICMDDTTALTVTHCGHLFCSECLHSSLHIDSMKRTCPVCRSKVDLRDKRKKTAKTYYPLELKVMTATKKGKRPAVT